MLFCACSPTWLGHEVANLRIRVQIPAGARPFFFSKKETPGKEKELICSLSLAVRISSGSSLFVQSTKTDSLFQRTLFVDFMTSKKIVVGMSGGVDSSMTMLLLKKAGWEPIGVSLKLAKWENECNGNSENACCTEESFSIAKKICEKIGAEHHIYDVADEFEKEVIEYVSDELKRGRTPNPCLMCNRNLKFAKLLEWADLHGIEHVATGHYAKVEKKADGKFGLFMGSDLSKDQTYGLCMLRQSQLSRIVLPLCDYTKEQIYSMIENEGFEFFLKRKQSQDLCFVSSSAYSKFVESRVGILEGDIVDASGHILGKHKGLHFYTRGQKCGIAGGTIYYANKFDLKKNLLIATDKKEDLMDKEVILEDVNYLSEKKLEGEILVMAKIRHGRVMERANFEAMENGRAKVVFENLIYAPMPGQFCAFYFGEECLGGGRIC